MPSEHATNEPRYWGLRVDRLLGMTLSQWQQFEPEAADGLLYRFGQMSTRIWQQRMRAALSEHAKLLYRPDKPAREMYLIFADELRRQECFDKLRSVLGLYASGSFLVFQGKSYQNLSLEQARADYDATWRRACAAENASSKNPTIQNIGCEITDVFINLYRVRRDGRKEPLVAWDRPRRDGLSSAKSIGGKMEYHRGRQRRSTTPSDN